MAGEKKNCLRKTNKAKVWNKDTTVKQRCSKGCLKCWDTFKLIQVFVIQVALRNLGKNSIGP